MLEGPGRLVMDRRPVPDPIDAEDAVVEIELAGLCGSDLHPYLGREPAAPGVVQGHEGIGRVVAAGDLVDTSLLGERVIVPFTTSCGRCRPCMRSLTSRCERGSLFGWGSPGGGPYLDGLQAGAARVPLASTSLIRLPEDVPAGAGVLLADNLPTAVHAVRQADLAPGAPIGVVGLGSVGLCAVAFASGIGLEVVGIDPLPERRRVARALGATTLAPHEVDGLHVDGAVEASGTDGGQSIAARVVAAGGTVSIIAVQTPGSTGIDPVLAYDRNLTVRYGRAPVRALLDELLPGVAAHSIPVPHDLLITHPDVPLEDGPETYRRFADRDDGIIKATFRPIVDR